MDTVVEFEDMLRLMHMHKVRYLVVGGLAFIYHAKPRFTKDIDLWVDPAPANIECANRALAEFGSPFLLEAGQLDQIVQIGMPPSRIDLLQSIEGMAFETAWSRRERGRYGRIMANWIDLESLLAVKERIPDARHQRDARELRKVRELRAASKRKPAATRKPLQPKRKVTP